MNSIALWLLRQGYNGSDFITVGLLVVKSLQGLEGFGITVTALEFGECSGTIFAHPKTFMFSLLQ